MAWFSSNTSNINGNSNTVIQGVNSEGAKKKNWAFIFGVFFIIVVLVFITLVPCPTKAQYNVYRIVLSIAIAGFAAVIPGFFEIEYKKYALALVAGGALGVFVFVYVIDPAQLVGDDNCNSLSVKGTILIDNKPASNVKILFLRLNKQPVNTNEFGNFETSLAINELSTDTIMFHFSQTTINDTIIKISTISIKPAGILFKLKSNK